MAFLVSAALFGTAAAATWEFETLHAFSGADGDCVWSPLVRGADGQWYGTTRFGGALDWGTVFRLKPGGGADVVRSFGDSSTGAAPRSLLLGHDGMLYGVTEGGWADLPGTVFRMSADGQVDTLLSIRGDPMEGLVQGRDGTLYGTYGRYPNPGYLYSLSPSGNFEILHEFPAGAGPTGGSPLGTLVIGPDDAIYGTTQDGGEYRGGSAYRITPDGTFTLLRSFGRPLPFQQTAYQPLDGIAFGSTGTIYGTLSSAGVHRPYGGLGAVYRMSATGADYAVLSQFTREGEAGFFPMAGPLVVGASTVLGVTRYGPPDGGGNGRVYGVVGRQTQVLHAFTADEYGYPMQRLVADAEGGFLGSTCPDNSPDHRGIVFRIRPRP